MKIDPITKIITYPLGEATSIRYVKKREGCNTIQYGGCQYFCLSEDNTNKVVGLGTCYHHSGLEQHEQNNHPQYWEKYDRRYPAW